MNEQNPNNIIVIDRISKKVLNKPNIEIDEEAYDEAVSKLVEKLLVVLRQNRDLNKLTPRSAFSYQKPDSRKTSRP